MASESPPAGPLLVFANPDKPPRPPAIPRPWGFPWPARILFAGPPGVGKRNMILNVVAQLDPKPSAFHVVHFEPDTPEYDILEDYSRPVYFYGADGFPSTDDLVRPPPPEGLAEAEGEEAAAAWSAAAGEAPLVIIDEITTEALGPQGSHRMERLLGYGSSHHNISVLCSIQGATNIPPKARRLFDHFVLWRQPDRFAAQLAADVAGVSDGVLKDLLTLARDRHDSVWVDHTRPPDDPWRFRLNLQWPVQAA